MHPIQILKYIDCSEKEAETYLLLLRENQGISALNLSRKLGQPRATVYGYLSSLIKKGLVKKGLTEDGALFYAESIDAVMSIYDEKLKKIHKAKQKLKNIAKSDEMIDATYSPKFVLYDNPNAAQIIFRDILRSNEKQIYWFWPAKDMIKTVPKQAFENFHSERKKRNIWLYVLWPSSKKVDLTKNPFLGPKDKNESLRIIKILEGKIDQTMGYGIYGTKVAFISSKKENYGFIIDSRELSQTFKSQFDYFWKKSKAL